jgi:hypothetical protein
MSDRIELLRATKAKFLEAGRKAAELVEAAKAIDITMQFSPAQWEQFKQSIADGMALYLEGVDEVVELLDRSIEGLTRRN